jgi:DNA-binding beta-propeller fold protein YncE
MRGVHDPGDQEGRAERVHREFDRRQPQRARDHRRTGRADHRRLRFVRLAVGQRNGRGRCRTRPWHPEYSNTVSLIRDGRQVAVESAPLQPGGVAAALDGSVVVVVGVRGRRIEAYATGGRPLGSAPCGVGPTHVRAGPHNLFYVTDTEGNQVLTYAVTASGPRQVGAAPTTGGAPYGIAVDPVRGLVYVTLTATNTVEAFRIEGQALVPDGQWPTVRQPNDVAVDTVTGRVYIAGRDENQLEMLASA